MPQQIQEELAEDGILSIPTQPKGGYRRVWDNTLGAVEVDEPEENDAAAVAAEHSKNSHHLIIVPYIHNNGSSLGFTVTDPQTDEMRELEIPVSVAENTESFMDYLDENIDDDAEVSLSRISGEGDDEREYLGHGSSPSVMGK